MKKKLLSLTLLCLFLYLPAVFAEAADDKVEPNTYEKKDILINSQLHGDQKHKDELPEIQKGLTFEESKHQKYDTLKNGLFHSAIIQPNSISAKSNKMGLFEDTSRIISQKKEEEVQANSASIILLLLGIAAVTIMLLLFLLIIFGARHQGHVKHSK